MIRFLYALLFLSLSAFSVSAQDGSPTVSLTPKARAMLVDMPAFWQQVTHVPAPVFRHAAIECICQAINKDLEMRHVYAEPRFVPVYRPNKSPLFSSGTRRR